MCIASFIHSSYVYSVLQHAWILIMVQQNINQKCEGRMDGEVYQNFWPMPSQV